MEDEYEIIDEFNEKFVDIKEINEDDDPSNLNDNIVVFNTQIYFDKILESYENNYENVFRQLTQDYYRHTILLNNVLVSYDEYIIFISKYNKNILMTLTTQASFFMPYYMMYKIYIRDNTIIKDAGEKKIINFIIDKKKLIIKFKLLVNLFNTITEKIIYNIDIESVIELLDNKLTKCGILTWSILK
jgi:hypothetical protein